MNDDFSRSSPHDYYTQTDAWGKFLKSDGHKYNLLTVIIEMLLIFPTNSAGVERVFSATTWLKNERRNRMLDDF